MRVKTRNSLWLVLALAAVVLLQGVGLALQAGELKEQSQEIADQSLKLWSQQTTSDANLSACQEAVKVAQEFIGADRPTFVEYTFDSVAQDCLRR